MDVRLENLTIDAERLWDTLMETAEFGRTPKGGIKRLTLTDLDSGVWGRAAATYNMHIERI